MLALPLHRSDPYNMGTQISSFFKTQDMDVAALEPEINQLNVMRAQAVSVSKEPSDSSALLRYNFHLSSLAARFASYEAELRFEFTYADPFKSMQKYSSSNVYFEWACVMWNLAALESIRGIRMDRSTDEGIRSAAKCFQLACGILEDIRQKVLPAMGSARRPTSLTDDGINMAKNLMFAQAQMCFYEKAVMDKKTGTMKSAIVGKLAQQASIYFNQMYTYTKANLMATVLDKSWGAYAQFQAQAFAGCAEFWTAMGAKENALQKGTGFGEEIVRLGRAEACFTQACTIAKGTNLAVATYGGIETMLRTTTKSRTSAVKDNSTIYMDAMPSENQVPQVAPISMVRPSNTLEFAGEKQLFDDFMPREVLALGRKYSEELSCLIRDQTLLAGDQSNLARSSLSSVGLPSSLEAYKCGDSFPPNLWQKIERVQSSGGVAELRRKMQSLNENVRECEAALFNVSAKLRREVDDDELFRTRCVGFSAPRSKDLSADIQNHLKVLQEAFDAARMSDKAMAADMESPDFVRDMERLSLTKEALTDLLPRAHDSDNPIDTSALEKLLIEISLILEERETAVKSLIEVGDRPVATLYPEFLRKTSLRQSEDTIIAEALAPTSDIVTKIAQSIDRQGLVMPELMRHNDEFTADKNRYESSVARERNDTILGLEKVATQYATLNTQLGMGMEFYRSLEIQITSLLQSTNDMCHSQYHARHSYETQEAREYDRINMEAKDRQMAMELDASFKREQEEQERRRREEEAAAAARAAFEAQHRAQEQQRQLNGNPAQPPQRPMATPSAQPPGVPFAAGGTQAYGTTISYAQSPTYGGSGNAPNPTANAAMGHVPSDPYMGQSSVNAPPSALPGGSVGAPVGATAPTMDTYSSLNNPYHASVPAVPPKTAPKPEIHVQQTQSPNPYPPYTQPQSQSNQPPSMYPSLSSATVGGQQQPSQYPSLPGAPGAPAGRQLPVPLDENKISRLVDMGFPRDKVVSALESANQNEEVAISMLLSPPPPAQSDPPPAPPSSSSSKGMFGKLWGKK